MVGRQRITLDEVKAAEPFSNSRSLALALFEDTAKSLSRQGRDERWAPSLSTEPTCRFIPWSLWIKRLWDLNRERAECAPSIAIVFYDSCSHAPRTREEVDDEVITCAALREERTEERLRLWKGEDLLPIKKAHQRACRALGGMPAEHRCPSFIGISIAVLMLFLARNAPLVFWKEHQTRMDHRLDFFL